MGIEGQKKMKRDDLKRKYDETFQYPNPDGLQGKALYERRAELAEKLAKEFSFIYGKDAE